MRRRGLELADRTRRFRRLSLGLGACALRRLADPARQPIVEPETVEFLDCLSVRLKTCGVIGIICVSKEVV